MTSELESDIREHVDWGKKWLVSFDRSNNTVDVKMDGSCLEEKSSFKMLGLAFSSKWTGALALSLLLKLSPRKLEPYSF